MMVQEPGRAIPAGYLSHSFLVGRPVADGEKAGFLKLMLVRTSRNLLSVFATLSLVCTLIVSACPTCDLEVHAANPSADDCCQTGSFVNDWQAQEEGCACCESGDCSDGEELPQGLTQRSGSANPIVAAPAAVAALVPPGSLPGAMPERIVDPPGRTKLHIQHASFLC